MLSAELASSYKPDPAVYRSALHVLRTDPHDAGMVAAHPADLTAAAALGIRPLYVHRPTEWGRGVAPPPAPQLDGLVEVDSLVELARELEVPGR